jgi:hypothetical protein
MLAFELAARLADSCSEFPVTPRTLIDTNGPLLPFTSWTDAAVQLAESGHSIVAQKTDGTEVCNADEADFADSTIAYLEGSSPRSEELAAVR